MRTDISRTAAKGTTKVAKEWQAGFGMLVGPCVLEIKRYRTKSAVYRMTRERHSQLPIASAPQHQGSADLLLIVELSAMEQDSQENAQNLD